MTQVRVSGASLYVEEVGAVDAPPLIVIHGGPGEAHDYLRPHFDKLASDRRRVIYFDQRGSGRSPLDAGEPYADASTHVRDIDAVRAHFMRNPVDLVGFSWGALLAILYALEFPQNVSSLVLVSPVPVYAGGMAVVSTNLERSEQRPEMMTFRQQRLSSAATDPQQRFLLAIAPCFFDPERTLALTPVVSNEDAARAAMQSLGNFDLRPRLGALAKIPTLVIYGAEDPVSAPLAEATADALGARRFALERSGHAPFVEAADTFFLHVTRFLDELDHQ